MSISTVTHHTPGLIEIKSWKQLNFPEMSDDKQVLIINDNSPKPPTNLGYLLKAPHKGTSPVFLRLFFFICHIYHWNFHIFITSRQDHCNSFSLQQAFLRNSLQTQIWNSSAHLLTHIHITPVCQNLLWLSVKQYIYFKTLLCLVHWTFRIFICLHVLLQAIII